MSSKIFNMVYYQWLDYVVDKFVDIVKLLLQSKWMQINFNCFMKIN